MLFYESWSQPPVSYSDTMLWAACCLGFFGFLRSGEFTSTSPSQSSGLLLSDVTIDSHNDPQRLTVNLRHSKTDRYGAGVTICLGRTYHTLCPVMAVLSYLAQRPSQAGPLFIFPDGTPLLRGYLVARVRETLQSHGFDTSRFSGHSFRVGAATTAAEVGLGDAVIQQLGRWRSAAYSIYIRPPCQFLLQARSRLVAPVSSEVVPD